MNEEDQIYNRVKRRIDKRVGAILEAVGFEDEKEPEYKKWQRRLPLADDPTEKTYTVHKISRIQARS